MTAGRSLLNPRALAACAKVAAEFDRSMRLATAVFAAHTEASRAAAERGNPLRRSLSQREQRYAVELAKRSPFSVDQVADMLRRLPARERPRRARRLVEIGSQIGWLPW